jgi:ER membrane protein complex subunit 7
MKLSPIRVLPGLLLPLSALSAQLTISIQANTALPNPSGLPSSTHAILSSHGSPLKAQLTRFNTFVFSNVPPGSHLLSVSSRDAVFENLRVDVTKDQTGAEYVEAWTTWRGNEWDNKGEVRGEGDGRNVRIEVRPMAPKEFYYERQTCKHIR